MPTPHAGPREVREVRVFFGSSREMSDEREAFPKVLSRLGERPEIDRNYQLKSVRWESEAFGQVGDDIDETIQETVDFDRLDIVVIGVWNRIGTGTLGEYDAAQALFKLHGRPRLLVYCRRPTTDDIKELARLEAFRKQVIDDGGVPNVYDDSAEFEARLEEHLQKLLPRPERRDPASLRDLNRWFLLSAVASFVLSAVLLWFPSNISAPDDGFTYNRILAVLSLPPIVALVLGIALWFYHRLLDKLAELWHSPDWDDGALYAAFRHLIPAWSIPRRLREQFPARVESRVAVSLLLLLAFVVPVVAQYQALYREILHWPYVSGWDVLEDDRGQPIVREGPHGKTVESVFVDETRREPWTFGLREERVIQRQREKPDEILYVHSEGQFRRGDEVDGLFRHNLGPAVFLPEQPLIYFVLMVAGAVGVLATLIRLLCLPGQLTPGNQPRRIA